MLFQWICLFSLLFSFPLYAQDFLLRDLLREAKPGEYIVMAQGRNQVVLLIRDHHDDVLTLEEITLPEERKPRQVPRWKEWVSQGAPGNSAWVAYSIGLEKGNIIECYSYTKKGWCDIPSSENFLGTLLKLPLTPLDPAQRRRIGPMPREHERDERPFWNPPMMIEGKVIPNVAFDAWRTRWPRDEGEMSNKLIDIYLPKKGSPGLTYFPYWLQIGGAVGKVQVRIIDSGLSLTSPKPILPLRPLSFVHTGCWQEGVFHLWLQTRAYHGAIRLFAVEANGPPIPKLIPYTLRPTQDPNIQMLELSPERLAKHLEAGHSYRWRAVSTLLPAIWTEMEPLPYHPPTSSKP